ncbi:zinc finger protein 341-like [Galleria mellonella]|uniref:Zinc finger protein 341-like n=1 Tax=Galleria mellonella TaxID=7137 RepID=A0A6J3BTI2_GALME|nr:zinc finger protein 341-like [Galleria mellonella]XP_031763707.2 zinc finger protein 341-like [Galleria mellonella]XP_052755572.1 zinc finger protein 341-like [Galleria mellonella]
MAHILVLDSVQDVFICGCCKTVFNSLQVFLDHKSQLCNKDNQPQLLEPANNIVSPKCALSTPDTLSEDNNIRDITCNHCSKKFKKITSLFAHLKTHNDKPYQCPICGRCFVQNSHLQRHIKCHRVWPEGLSKTTATSTEVDLLSYSCSYCDMVLSNYIQFRGHLKNHLSLKKFKCVQDGCVSLYDSIEGLLHHVTVAHLTPKYSCHNATCSKVYNSLEDIASHYQNHDECRTDRNSTVPKKYKCLQCDATFRRLEKLSLHMVTETHKKTCIHCGKIFASDKRLRLHLQIHRKLKPFQCNVCNSSFHMKKYLSVHMLKHGDRQYTCSICRYMFKRPDLLQRHMKLHQLRRKFTCPFKDTLNCKKEFSRSDKLKTHMKLHTKHMPLCSTPPKTLPDHEAGTVEICIVPLDKNNK